MRTLVTAFLIVMLVIAGNVSALTPNDLTTAERTKYEALKSSTEAAESFLATRAYVRKAAAIVAEPKNKKTP